MPCTFGRCIHDDFSLIRRMSITAFSRHVLASVRRGSAPLITAAEMVSARLGCLFFFIYNMGGVLSSKDTTVWTLMILLATIHMVCDLFFYFLFFTEMFILLYQAQREW